MRGRPISLGAYLFILLLCTVTPIILFASWLVLNFAKGERRSTEAGLKDTNRALATALDREFQSSVAALNVLATSKLLDNGDLRQFYALCERARATQAGWETITLQEPSGKTLLTLSAPFGKPVRPILGKESFEKVLRTKDVAILELVKGSTFGWIFGVRIPVLRADEVKYVLTAIIEPSRVGAIMGEQKLPASWLGGILDHKHHLVASSRYGNRLVGQRTMMAKDAPANTIEGSFRDHNRDGVLSYSFFRRAPFSGWYVVLNVPADLLDGPVKRSLIRVIMVGLFALLLGSLFAIIMSRRINASVAGIRTLAQALGLKQEIHTIEKGPVFELNTITEALYDASKLLQGSEAKQRTAEEQLREANNHLEQRVAERTAALEDEIRKKQTLENALRNQALLLQLAHDAIIVRSLEEGQIHFWNHGATEIYGWNAAEAIGARIHELLRCRSSACSLKEIEEAVARQGRWEGELVRTGKDGTELVLDSRWSILRDSEGRPVEILELTSDITARKYAEQRAQENEWLAGVGTMTAIFAHEIGNPLHAISTSLDLVERQLGKLRLDSRIKKTLELSTHEIQRVSTLLTEFRAFARPQKANLKPGQLVDLINDVLVPQIAFCRKSGVTIKRELAQVRPLLLDEDKIKQVIVNLCKNAIEAMPDGGVLTVKTQQSGDLAVIEISDTGVGIPEGVDVFRLFTTTKSDGTGLGLPLVRQIINAHRGSIHYTTQAGQGTTFRICLPTGLTDHPDTSSQPRLQSRAAAETEKVEA
ncbi:MAG: ATP-binding protein [Alphaproteobacteria bacterium]